MIKWFLGNRPIVLLLLPVLIAILVLVRLFFIDELYIEETWGMWGTYTPKSNWIYLVFGPLLLLFLSIRISRLFNSHAFSDKNTYIPSLVYLVFFALFPVFYSLTPSVVCSVFLLFMLFQLFDLQQNTDGRRAVFNGGLFFGLAISFAPSLIVALPFIYFMVLVVRPFILRELILLLSGVITPLIYVALFLWYNSEPVQFIYSAPEKTLDAFPMERLISVLSICAIMLIAFFSISTAGLKMSIRSKRLTRMLLWLCLPLVIIGINEFLFYGELNRLSLLSLPLSLLIALSFLNKKITGALSILLYILLALVIFKLFQ
jgi:hypothetical protein